MGRPRRPYNGVEDIVWSDDKWLRSQKVGGLGVRQERRWEAQTHWTWKVPNGIYDPLTVLHILDVVANIDPDIELRAKNLVEFLTKERPQFSWDVITVGKVLADICDNFEDVLQKKNGILEGGADYKGKFYRIHHNSETARLYYALREDLVKLVEIEMAERSHGRKSMRLSSPLDECPSVRVDFPVEIEA